MEEGVERLFLNRQLGLTRVACLVSARGQDAVFIPSAQRLCCPSRKVVSTKKISLTKGFNRLEYGNAGILE
jgi:hypothetical protein